MRFFSVFSIARPNQKEKISKPSDGMILKGKEPVQAAKKAMSKLCRKIKGKKKLHGRCALRISLVELQVNDKGTGPKMYKGKVMLKRDSKGIVKMKTYRLQFRKLKEPVTVIRNGKKITYRHKSVVTSYLNKKTSSTRSRKVASAPMFAKPALTPVKMKKKAASR